MRHHARARLSIALVVVASVALIGYCFGGGGRDYETCLQRCLARSVACERLRSGDAEPELRRVLVQRCEAHGRECHGICR